MQIKRISFLLLLLLSGLSACSKPSSVIQPTQQANTPDQIQPIGTTPITPSAARLSPSNPTRTSPIEEPVVPSQGFPIDKTSTPQPNIEISPDDWKDLPVIPEISQSVIQIYQRGLELGNNPSAFSKIGDCGSTPAWFLGDFDRGSRYYNLGNYSNLTEVINAYQGSYSRTSLAAKAGFNVSSILSPLWADPQQCLANESPLACEYRIHRPAAAIIMLGSNDVFHPDEFEPGMRQLIEYSIDNSVIPILSTKADNEEGDGSLNATIARLAMEYDIPLLNYWRALQGLPENGLQEDGVHITWGPNDFSDAQNMQRGWPVRNLTTLQILNAVWRKLTSPSVTP